MLWDLAEGKRLYSLDAGDVIHALCFSPNRYWLCAATQACIKVGSLRHSLLGYTVVTGGFARLREISSVKSLQHHVPCTAHIACAQKHTFQAMHMATHGYIHMATCIWPHTLQRRSG